MYILLLIKVENFIVNIRTGQVRIFNFDEAQQVRDSGLSDFWGGTLRYFSPEICLFQQGYSLEKNAVWQLAVVWFAGSFKQFPFEGVNNIVNDDARRAIFSGLRSSDADDRIIDLQLMQDMLAKNPSTRPTLDEVVRRLKNYNNQSQKTQ